MVGEGELCNRSYKAVIFIKYINYSKLKKIMISKNDVLILMPAYNEGKVISNVIDRVKGEGYENILVVDDGSSDDTFEKALSSGVEVVRHSVNRGQGAGFMTGIEFAKRENFKYLVTIDSDGQHSPKDITKHLRYLEKYDVVIGSRLIDSKKMPFVRYVYNKIGSMVTYFVFGLLVKDSQTGFRMLSRKAIESIDLKFDRYENCSEFVGEIKKNKLKFCEKPIKVIYTNYSLAKGQNFFKGVKMVVKFVLDR